MTTRKNALTEELTKNVTEKCASAFETNDQFVSCQVLNIDELKRSVDDLLEAKAHPSGAMSASGGQVSIKPL